MSNLLIISVKIVFCVSIWRPVELGVLRGRGGIFVKRYFRDGVPSYEIDFWLDYRNFNMCSVVHI